MSKLVSQLRALPWPAKTDSLFLQNRISRVRVNPSYQFQMKIRFLEVANEEATDLLQPGGTSFGKQHIKTDEWEGPYVQGIHWVQVPSLTHLVDFFKGGCRNVTGKQNEFGKMRDKATQIF